MNASRIHFAKKLRQEMTDAERCLWKHLRAHRLLGAKFKRQQVIGPYIADFVCFDTRLVIELDGGQHMNDEADSMRDAWLNNQGFHVLRFWNNEVLSSTTAVLESIAEYLPPLPTPSPARGEGQGRGSIYGRPYPPYGGKVGHEHGASTPTTLATEMEAKPPEEHVSSPLAGEGQGHGSIHGSPYPLHGERVEHEQGVSTPTTLTAEMNEPKPPEEHGPTKRSPFSSVEGETSTPEHHVPLMWPTDFGHPPRW